MREIRKSGSMSGEGKRSDARRPKPPRPSSTLLRAPESFFGFPAIADIRSLGGVEPVMIERCLSASMDSPTETA